MQLVASVSVPVVDAGHWIGCSLPCRALFSRALASRRIPRAPISPSSCLVWHPGLTNTRHRRGDVPWSAIRIGVHVHPLPARVALPTREVDLRLASGNVYD